MQRASRLGWLVGLAAGACAVVAPIAFVAPAAAQAQAAPPVSVSRVTSRNVQPTKTYVGTVMPARRSAIGAAVDGRVLEYYVRVGDAVQAGQPLAQLRTRTVQLEVAGARADLALREQELALLENGSRPEEIAQAQAQAAAAEAAAKYASARLRRVRTLAESRTATPDALEDAISAAEQAQHNVEALSAALDLAVAGPRQEQIGQAKARRDFAEAEFHRLSDIMEMYTIRAPFDGFVVAEHTEQGGWVNRGALVAEVIELATVEVETSVLENDVAQLRIGAVVDVEVAALPGRTFQGKVHRIVPQADVRSRSFPVRVLLENEITGGQPLLRAGMLARLKLPVQSARDRLLVSKDAVVLGGPTPVVYVFEPSTSGELRGQRGTVRSVAVTLGEASDESIEIIGELRADQVIVVKGNERLRPDQQVTVREVLP